MSPCFKVDGHVNVAPHAEAAAVPNGIDSVRAGAVQLPVSLPAVNFH